MMMAVNETPPDRPLWQEETTESFLLEVVVGRQRFGDAALLHE
jgi:hypothetical protein